MHEEAQGEAYKRYVKILGDEWMDEVEVVACDMNSDFQETFEEKCTHIQVVFDYFHIVKNFNDKVISEVRKDEQKRLMAEGRYDEAARLKKTKYILTSSRATLERKDEEGTEIRTSCGLKGFWTIISRESLHMPHTRFPQANSRE